MTNNQAKHNSEIAGVAVDTATPIIINPSPELRVFQNYVYTWLKLKAEPSMYSFFGVSNAVKDLDLFKSKYSFIYLDLESCYEKITYSRVVGLLRQTGLPDPTKWAKYCTFEGTLMRGGIPSNYILELILRRMDYRLHGLATQFNYKYHRYVDDLYFFSSTPTKQIVAFQIRIEKVIGEEGFDVNHSKTSIFSDYYQQEQIFDE